MAMGILGKTALCLVGGGGVALTGCYAGGILKFGEKKDSREAAQPIL